jgi:hypothetical protein
MLTVIETPEFIASAAGIWTDEEREAFINWIAVNPEAGDVIPGTRGLRKVRWKRQGMGKRSGARAVYFVRTARGEVSLLVAYAKAKFDKLPADFQNRLKEKYDA